MHDEAQARLLAARRRAALGERIRHLRQERGLTQIQLAQSVGVERKSVVRYETGAGSPTVDVLYRLADVLQVGAEALLDGRPQPEGASSPLA